MAKKNKGPAGGNHGPTADSPAAQGFSMPAEWQPHEATWIAWPHQREDWPGKFAAIPWVYVEIVRHLQQAEQARILVNNEAMGAGVAKVLGDAGIKGFATIVCRTDRVWTRDYGPIFVTNAKAKQRAALNFRFNGWAKYDNHKADDAVTAKLCRHFEWPSWRPSLRGRPVVLEGGSIDVNGAGLLLTTEECLLSDVQQRNPSFTRDDYEQVFADYLGVHKTLWLNRGIAGDDTHGHVDDLARFVAAQRIVTVVERKKSDANYEPLQENLVRLKKMTDLGGKRLEIVELPMPGPVVYQGQRLPASYANFYIASDRVLVPTFNDPNDRVALGILAGLFPERIVVGIHAVDLVWGLGTLHCLTQQQAKV